MKTTCRILLIFMVLSAHTTISLAQDTNKKEEQPKTEVAHPIQLTEYDFNMKIADIKNHPHEFKYIGTRPCVIDFYADWCGPCRMLSPILNELSKEYAGKVDFYKINVDKEQNLARAFAIRSIPTLLFIPMEGKPTLMQGASPKGELKKTIDELLLKKEKE